MDNILRNSPTKVYPNVVLQSPVRPPKLNLSSCSPTSPGFRDFCPWRWAERAQQVELSPTGTNTSSSAGSPAEDLGSPRSRGRPRTEILPELQKFGSKSPCGIQCKFCQRVFPREKSLQAHMRTHTGERPYVCDYPRCGRAFVQSGQLKTHQRLHTGEKPFACSVEGCKSRFAHANRHCPDHPWAHMSRQSSPIPVKDAFKTDENSEEVAEWLKRYYQNQRLKMEEKKRKNSQREDTEHEIGETPKKKKTSVRRLLDEQRDKYIGAMALMELAQNACGAI